MKKLTAPIDRFLDWWIGDVIIDAKYGLVVTLLAFGPTFLVMAAVVVLPILACIGLMGSVASLIWLH